MKLACNGGNPVVEKGDHKHYPIITDEDKAAVMGVLDSGVLWGNHSEQVKALEKEWAEYVGTKYCVATNSGTAALHIAVVASGVKPGDEVIVPTYSFLSTATSALFHNAIPIFVDIEPRTFNIDVSKIEERITDRTRAIVPVHVHGMPADMDPIMAIAEKHGLKVIEDAAQAHGASYNGKMAGDLGHMGCFSLNASKGVVAGEGGLFTTSDVTLRDTADTTAVFGEVLEKGKTRDYNATAMGFMYRTQEMSAALARSQIRRLEGYNATRRANAAHLDAGLSKIPGVIPPHVPEDRTHAYHLYRVSLDTNLINPDLDVRECRNKVMRALKAEGLDCELWTGLIPVQGVFQAMEGYGGGCPWTCHGRPGIKYDLGEYQQSFDALNNSFCIYSAVQPSNGIELADKYIEAFNKVFDNLDQVWALD